MKQKIIIALTGTICAVALIAFGQIARPLPVPVEWTAADGDGFGLNQSGVPYIIESGSKFTGASTNVWTSNGTNDIRLNFVNGVFVGVSDAHSTP